MELYLSLYLGHLLGDFLFQPGRLVAAKREGMPGLALHILIIGASTAVIMISQLIANPGGILPLIVFISTMHLVIEEVTILAYVRTPTRGLFTFLLDQALHVLSMALLVWLYGDASPAQVSTARTATILGLHLPMAQAATLAGLATVVLFGRILSFETVNAMLYGNESKGRMLAWDGLRLAGSIERAASLLAALLLAPFSWALIPIGLIVPFLPGIAIALLRCEGDARKERLIDAATSVGMTALAWAFVVATVVLTASGGTSGATWWAPAIL